MPLRNLNELSRLANQLYDPASPVYRHFLTVQQFTDEFGPTAQDYEAVISYFQKNGFTIRNTSENRLILDVAGSVAQVNSVLGASMNIYRDPNGKRTFFSPDREPTLDLGVSIAHIEGLNDFSVPQPMFHIKKNAAPIANVTGCTFTIVESSESASILMRTICSNWSFSKTRSNTPFFAQRFMRT